MVLASLVIGTRVHGCRSSLLITPSYFRRKCRSTHEIASVRRRLFGRNNTTLLLTRPLNFMITLCNVIESRATPWHCVNERQSVWVNYNMNDASVVVIVWSNERLGSDWVEFALTEAVLQTNCILPVIIITCYMIKHVRDWSKSCHVLCYNFHFTTFMTKYTSGFHNFSNWFKDEWSLGIVSVV